MLLTIYMQHPHCFTCIFPTAIQGVTIGFDNTLYSVSEGANSVSTTVSIQNGMLARNVAVTVYTVDATARNQGERDKTLCLFLEYSNNALQ